jgi:hypothetical protein
VLEQRVREQIASRDLRQQDAVAQALRRQRQANGALEFDRGEIKPLMTGDEISDVKTVRGGRRPAGPERSADPPLLLPRHHLRHRDLAE